ncbi:Rgp1p NDAI_0J01170 [Naumovozyma dairenensis CBS 421]|uniref:Uncharacterized protein n=1 Tax=Naumovozyma dairenensis (strain ATCC 10597 / BCRC 20456 / CBS 421 / NBRC 0211 / NRRL Y-12639) TaxID=1071378 RepID=G0WGT1_NAUDC|nr:hypothetical protein NDAI_0J01170 [Naumovozyma dairenensis CBS 421]CCD27009.1 hypothetical protein NDAI_0J01170 [Naumovozyma dairenensis CBS 421]
MHSHRIDSFLISDNLRLEIVHELNPYFAGEHISMVFRLRHLGKLQEYNNIKSRVTELEASLKKYHEEQERQQELLEKNKNDQRWSMKSFISAFKKDRKDAHGSIETKSEGPREPPKIAIEEPTDDETNEAHTETPREGLDHCPNTKAKDDCEPPTEIDPSIETKQNKLDPALTERLIEQLHRQKSFHNPIDLISAYVQISGIFQFDPNVINESNFEPLESKIVGVDALSSRYNSHKTNDKTNDKLSPYFNSNFNTITNGLLSFDYKHSDSLNGTSVNAVLDLGNIQNIPEKIKQFPILLIPQTLLFSEIFLEPGEVKTFYFKSSKLPKDLCPTYTSSRNISLNYSMEFGTTRINNDDMIPYVVQVPIQIAPFINEKGYQYTSVINKKPYILKAGSIKEVRRAQNKRKISTASTVSFSGRRNSSLKGSSISDNHENIGKVTQNFIKLVEMNQNGMKHIEELVDLQLEVQFPSENDNSENENNITKEEMEFLDKHTYSVKNNISSLKLSAASFNMDTDINNNGGDDNSNPQTVENKATSLQPQLLNLQKKYLISKNGHLLARLTFPKLFFTTSDDIDLIVTLVSNPESKKKVTAITVALESFELINPKYNVKSLGDSPVPKRERICESHAICFDGCDSVPFKLVIPKTPMSQLPTQFKTDIFQFKWTLSLKFVLVDGKENVIQQKFYEDKKGALFHSNETVEGEFFQCHVPIILLPSSTVFWWVVEQDSNSI